MKSTLWKPMLVAVAVLAYAGVAQADDFGTGANQFSIDFVTISGAAGDGYGGQSAGSGFTTTNIDRDYRMGTFEITNDQYAKFAAELGVPVTGDPSSAYDLAPYWTGANVPSNRTSWYEAAQFVNYLNTSTGHQAAYRFTGTQGTGDYALATWSTAEADGTNLYRHKDAFYFLPTEDEWVKAAYWNGTSLQTWATKPGETLHQGDGVSGTGWNFWDGDYVDPYGPWDVGSGSEEFNGTFDMMGNVWEWMESPYSDTNYGTGSDRGLRGGDYYIGSYYYLASSDRSYGYPYYEDGYPNYGYGVVGFRVASEVPEPMSVALLSLGIVALLKRRNK